MEELRVILVIRIQAIYTIYIGILYHACYNCNESKILKHNASKMKIDEYRAHDAVIIEISIVDYIKFMKQTIWK